MLGPTTLFDEVLRQLEQHMSPINARGALERAVARLGTRPDTMSRAHLPALSRELRVALQLFLDPSETQSILRSLAELTGTAVERLAACRIEVATEADIAPVRRAARELCSRVGARTFAAQKVLTIVSELARNIASYSHGGAIDLTPATDVLGIAARDRGPGIADLTRILAGQYRSRTGLGLGILGVKRLADRFDITTSATGTEIVAEVRL